VNSACDVWALGTTHKNRAFTTHLSKRLFIIDHIIELSKIPVLKRTITDIFDAWMFRFEMGELSLRLIPLLSTIAFQFLQASATSCK